MSAPTLPPPNPKTAQPHRWTRAEYRAIADTGLFDQQRIELIHGHVIDMSPTNFRHVQACSLLLELLRDAYPKSFTILTQMPLAIGDSEPIPDLAIIPGTIRDYTDHPTTALLVIEVADTSLTYDRTTKAPLYATAKIPEYWILNLPARQLEVHRTPRRTAGQWTYTERKTLTKSQSITPPQSASLIKIAAMLP